MKTQFITALMMGFLILQSVVTWAGPAKKKTEARPTPKIADQNSPISRNIILPLEGLLIQGVPTAMKSLIPEADRISTDTSLFAIRPFAQEFISELVKQNYKIHLFTRNNVNSANEITRLIKIDPAGKTLADVIENLIGDSDIKDNVFSAAKFKIKGNYILVLTSEFSQATYDAQALVTNLGQVFFYYPNYEMANQSRISQGWKANYFPKDAKAWAAERLKLGRLYIQLQEANQDSQNEFNEGLKKLAQENEDTLGFVGTQMLLHKNAPTILRFRLNAAETAVEGCEEVDARKGTVKAEAPIAKCVDNMNLIKAWKDRSRKTCAAYSENYVLIVSDQQGCKDKVAYVIGKKTIIFDETDELKRLSNADLEKYLQGPQPTESDPFQLFEKYNEKPHAKVLNFDECRSLNWQVMGGSMITPFCQPDTLYSWGPKQKVLDLKKYIGNDSPTWTALPRKIFLARSPITTFGYGEVPIRIKLKANVKFKAASFGCPGPSEEAKTTVFYRHDGDYSDWVICSPEVIHSWSYETPKHYDEMIKDYRRQIQKDHTWNSVDYYGNSQRRSNTIFSDFGGPNVDSHNFSHQYFQTNLTQILRDIKAGKGEIMYNPDLPASEKNSQAHFKTDHPVYFNEE